MELRELNVNYNYLHWLYSDLGTNEPDDEYFLVETSSSGKKIDISGHFRNSVGSGT
jgi:hypothetical protein